MTILGAIPTISLNAVADTTHSVAVHLNEGAIHEDQSPKFDELNDTGTGHVGIEYRLGLGEGLALTAGYFDGDIGDHDWTFDLTDSQLVYSGFTLGVDAEAPVSKRNRLFLRASLNNFDYHVRDDGRAVAGAHDDGTGYNIGGGWRYRFDNGFAVEAAVDSLHMGSDVDVRTFGIGLSYQFPKR